MQIIKPQSKAIAARLSGLGGLKQLERVAGKPLQKATGPQSVFMLLDCSGSMSGEKLIAAKTGARSFAESAFASGHSLGLITFESDAVVVSKITRILEQVTRGLDSAEVGGSTNLTEALRLAYVALRSLEGERLIYVITDGMPDDASSALSAAEAAKRCGIKLMALGTDDADKDFLAALASSPAMSVKVARNALSAGVASMAKLLGDGGTKSA